MKTSKLFLMPILLSFGVFGQAESNKITIRYDSTLKTYVMSEVKVIGLSLESFKKEILNMKMEEKPKFVIIAPKEPEIKIGNVILPVRPNPESLRPEFYKEISGPFTFLYNKFSREAKEKRKFDQLKKIDLFQERFKPAAQQETHLMKDSLRNFLHYCKPNIDSMMNLSEYEIREYIREKFKQFKKK